MVFSNKNNNNNNNIRNNQVQSIMTEHNQHVEMKQKKPMNDDENQLNYVNSVSSKNVIPFGKCKVCNDKATGYHYGIPSCEACKGFFKRTLSRKEKYRCYFGNDCPISRENRNNCKSCRFNRCLKFGMSIDASKLGRMANSSKQAAMFELSHPNEKLAIELKRQNTNMERKIFSKGNNQSVGAANSNEDCMNVRKTKLDDESNGRYASLPVKKRPKPSIDEKNDRDSDDSQEFDFLNRMFDLFSKSKIKLKRNHSLWPTCSSPKLDMTFQLTISFMSDKAYQTHIETNYRVAEYYQKALKLIQTKDIITYDGHDATMSDVWTGIFENIRFNIKNLAQYLRLTPGLGDKLNESDFKKLVNVRLFNYFLIKYAPLFIDGECYIRLENGIQYTKSWISKVLGSDIANGMMEFSNELNSICLTTKEIALLLPFVLTLRDGNLETSTFENTSLLIELNTYYQKALMYEFDLNLRSTEFVLKLKSILAMMPDLNKLYNKYFNEVYPNI